MEVPLLTRLGERVGAAAARDPAGAPHRLRNDTLLCLAMLAAAVALALVVPHGSRPDALGWTLLVAGLLPLVWRRRSPGWALTVMIVFIGPYHYLDYTHTAPVPGSMVLLYTAAATGRPRRTVLIGAVVIGSVVLVDLATGSGEAVDTLRVSGWIAAVLIAGANVRVYRRLVAASVERAERAESTREEVAARRVAEERLRIARDLHDLLAHSITVIGVQASAASHLLTAHPERLDRPAIAEALHGIAESCRTARTDVRSTLKVLRHDDSHDGPLPDLATLPDLTDKAGATLTMRTGQATDISPATGAAVYRIVQEALTNSVRHAGPGARPAVLVEAEDGELRVTVTDDGDPPGGTSGSGYGLMGMRERAISVGGTLKAGPREQGGFQVKAVLPLPNVGA